jgi:hypothetical protein
MDIREKLKVQIAVEEIESYLKNWKEHIERMQDNSPKLAFNYKPVGK